jgi:hypothetical protein
LPFLITQDPQSGKGREYGQMAGQMFDYFAKMKFKALANTILQGGKATHMQGVGKLKNKLLKINDINN